MKTTDEKELDNVIEVLRTAYHKKENVHVNNHWESRMMNFIRMKGIKNGHNDFYGLFQQFVWQIAPITSVLVILLGIAMAQMDFLSDYELAKIFLYDPSDLSFFSLYNAL
jgi:hypothetical protein